MWVRLRRSVGRVQNDGPILLLIAFIVTQTVAAAFAAEAVTRGIDCQWGNFIWIVAVALVLAMVAVLLWAMRGEARRQGTALTLSVPRGEVFWDDTKVFKRVKEYSRSERFLFYYPLRSPAVEASSAGVANWSKALDFHGQVLRSIFADDWGFDVDGGSRVSLSFVAPTPAVFELGSRWESVTDNRAQSVEVLDVSDPSDPSPVRVLWKMRKEGPPTSLLNQEWLSASTAVLLLQRNVDREVLRRALGTEGSDYVVIGEATSLSENDPKIDLHISQLKALLAARKANAIGGANNKLKLLLLTAAPAAFAAGVRLCEFRNDVDVLEYDRSTGKYFAVDFGEGGKQ